MNPRCMCALWVKTAVICTTVTDLMVIDFNVRVELAQSEEIVAGVASFINVERRGDVVRVDVVEPMVERRFGRNFDVESVKEARLSDGMPHAEGITRPYHRMQDFPIAAGLARFVASEPAHQL